MGKCTDVATLYDDIRFCQGQKSMPGMRSHIYGVSKRDVLSYPVIDRSKKTALGEIPVYDGDFVLAADKYWHRLDIIPNDGEFKSENQGSYGSKTFKNTTTVNLPGTEEEATGYIAEINNDEMLFLVPQRNGKYRLMGSEAFSPELKLSQSSGKATTDANQTTLEISADDEYPSPFYPGAILTSDGIISGATGKPVTDDKEP